jgi:hypothetical protein
MPLDLEGSFVRLVDGFVAGLQRQTPAKGLNIQWLA